LSTERLHILGIGVLALVDTTKIYSGCEYGMYLVAEAMKLGRTIQPRPRLGMLISKWLVLFLFHVGHYIRKRAKWNDISYAHMVSPIIYIFYIV